MHSIHDTSSSDSCSHTPPGIEPAEVEQALATILADDKFAAAPQMSAFLAYVVKQTLRGEADRIKAYTVAVDALGKPATFDPQNDPSVRVLAKRLRSSIDHYYGRTTGHIVVIELKSGSYKPRFIRAENLDDTVTDTRDVGSTDTAARNDAGRVHEGVESTSGLTPETPMALTAETDDKPDTNRTRHADVNHKSDAERAPTTALDGRLAADSSARHGNRRGLSAALRRLPHPAMTAITVLAIGWGITQHQQESSLRNELAAIVNGNGAIMGDQPLQIALASTSDGQEFRARPALPTVHLPPMKAQDPLGETMSASITRVLSRFENIEVIRQQDARDAEWPEDYELHFSDYRMGKRVRVEAQLLHSATGRVVSVDTFDLPDLTHDELTVPELAKIEGFAARLAQLKGPLIRDYLARADLSPAVACALGVDPAALATQGQDEGVDARPSEGEELITRVPADSSGPRSFECDRSTADNTQRSALELTQQADSLLGSLDELTGSARERSLDKALKLSRRAVQRGPFSAAAHRALMNSLQEKGRYDEALIHGQQALEFNRFDARTLRSVAHVMDSLNLADDGAELRSEAMRLDPVSSSTVAMNRS